MMERLQSEEIEKETERRKEFIFDYLVFTTIVISLIYYFFTSAVKIEKKSTNF